MRVESVCICIALTAAILSTTAAASPLTLLEAKLSRLAHESGSTVGIFVMHVERNEIAGVNVDRPFPLASTFKLPLAVAVLRSVERKELPALDANVHVGENDMLPGGSPLYERYPRGGEVTLRYLLSLMLETGDNSAANALVRIAGGAARVCGTLSILRLGEIHIARDETEQALDSWGAALPSTVERNPANINAAIAAVPAERHRNALQLFVKDPRDHASPRAMGRVAVRLWRSELLAPEHVDFMKAELARNDRGRRRIRAGVPAGVLVADRSGTCYGIGDDDSPCVNDVGVVTLPSGEHVVIAAFVEDTDGPIEGKEQLIASIARIVWNYFAGSSRR